ISVICNSDVISFALRGPDVFIMCKIRSLVGSSLIWFIVTLLARMTLAVACSECGFLAFAAAESVMLFLAGFAADMLEIAHGTVDIAVIRLAAMVAARNNDILVGTVDRHGNPLIEHIAFAVEQMSLYFRIFAVSDDSVL